MSDGSLEYVAAHVVDVLKVAQHCKTEEMFLAIARLKDAMANETTPARQARLQTLESCLADRLSGKTKRSWFAFASMYQGQQWAVQRLSGIEA